MIPWTFLIAIVSAEPDYSAMDSDCSGVLASLATSAVRLNPEDQILMTPFSWKIFQVSRVAQAVAKRMGLRRSGSISDQFLDFTFALREHHTRLRLYSLWLREVETLAREREIKSDVILGELADALFIKNPEKFFSLPLLSIQRPDIERMPQTELVEFRKDMIRLRNMSDATRRNFRLAVEKNGAMPESFLLVALRGQREVIREVLLTALKVSPDERMLKELRQFVLENLDYDFPQSFQMPTESISDPEVRARKRVIGVIKTFRDLYDFPESEDFLNAMLKQVTLRSDRIK